MLRTIVALMVLAFPFGALAQTTYESLLSASENAYNPIPNRQGTMIAYVRTGWGRGGGTGGFGRSNLRSEVMVMDAGGQIRNKEPAADAFLAGWTADGKNLICYRDYQYLLVSPGGTVLKQGQIPNASRAQVPERVSYLSSTGSFVWSQIENGYSGIQTVGGEVGRLDAQALQASTPSGGGRGAVAVMSTTLSDLIAPSPDGRYLAVMGAGNNSLWVYDRQNGRWADLGRAKVHPDREWDYLKASWDPWFADGSRLAFVSDEGLVVSTPDGRSRQVIAEISGAAGLAVPSPDGRRVAYVTFEARPMKLRPDLQFWGDTTVWVVPSDSGAKARPVTSKNADTTYALRWVSNRQLVFDRLADESLYSKARLWSVEVDR